MQRDIEYTGGQYIIRGRYNHCAKIIEAYDGKDQEFPELVGVNCQKAIDQELGETLDLIVEKQGYRYRVVKIFNAESKEWMVLTSSCKRHQLTADQVYCLYLLRWKNTELYFKQLKSLNTMHSINSGLKEIVLSFFLAAIASFLLKTTLAIETRKKLDPSVNFGNHFSPEKIQRRDTVIFKLLKATVKGRGKTQLCGYIKACINALAKLCRKDRSLSFFKWRDLKDDRAALMRIIYAKGFQHRKDFDELLLKTWTLILT